MHVCYVLSSVRLDIIPQIALIVNPF
jgi:hypothetical protein